VSNSSPPALQSLGPWESVKEGKGYELLRLWKPSRSTCRGDNGVARVTIRWPVKRDGAGSTFTVTLHDAPGGAIRSGLPSALASEQRVVSEDVRYCLMGLVTPCTSRRDALETTESESRVEVDPVELVAGTARPSPRVSPPARRPPADRGGTGGMTAV
jgi:hypothetical protein